MPESLLSRRLKLGTFAGIPLYVHWSFAFLVLYVVWASYDMGVPGVAFSLALLFGMFFCVTLHEYGHSLAARRFGIGTADITLLPIGGVARLQKMPRIPWQELVVAVAGPAVNVVIAVLLGAFLFFTMSSVDFDTICLYFDAYFFEKPVTDDTVIQISELLNQPSWLGFGLLILAVNLILVIFNMLPAFPMDGGRVFRAILAMFMDYQKATSIAFRIGVGCAVLMAFWALRSNPPDWKPLFIACFIMCAGLTEYRQVTVTETVRGLRVADIMVPSTLCISMDLPLEQVVPQLQNQAIPAVPVVSITGSVVGVVTMQDVLRELRRDVASNRTAGQMVDHNVSMVAVRSHQLLSDLIQQVDRDQKQVAVVNANDELVGLLDFDTMMVRSKLHRLADLAPTEPPPHRRSPHFDAVT